MQTYLTSVAYTLLQITTLPFTLLLLIIVHSKRRRQDNCYERLGFLKPSPSNKKVIWFHAVSAGEVLSLQEMITSIKHEHPETWCYLTVGTPIGRLMAEKNIAANTISYLPYDFLPCMLLAYARIRPQTIIVVESELWPHLFLLASWHKAQLFLINARISKRSKKRLTLLAPLVRILLNCCTAILTQSDTDSASFKALGIAENKIHTLGNIKAFNVFQKQQQLPSKKMPQHKNVLLAGSIHPTEDIVYLTLFNQLKKHFLNLKLVLVPRHFHWQEALILHAQNTGYPTTIWANSSPAETTIESLLSTADIVIVCRFGELFKLYQHATVFFLGGTFVPVGGHNLLEPAAWGIPSLVGPYHANCLSTLHSLKQHHAAKIVSNSFELLAETTMLLENSAQLTAMQEANIGWIKKEAHRVETAMRSILFRSLFDS